MKTEKEERMAMRQQRGRSPLPVLLGLVTGIVLMSSGVSTQVQRAWAQDTEADASHGLALLSTAPQWVHKASQTVQLRFTAKWQHMKQEAARTGLQPSTESDLSDAATTFGQRVFNKETTPGLPQNETTIAIDPSSASRIVGGVNDYRGIISPSGNFTGWSTSINGLTTVAKDGQIPAANVLGQTLPSGGDPAVDADKFGNFFMGTFWFDDTNPNGVGIARSPRAGSATGVFSAACPGGIVAACWPVRRVVKADACTSSGGFFHDKPYIAVDRSNSVAAGSVYLVWTQFGCANTNFSTRIQLVKCSNNLVACTAPFTLESTLGTASPFDFVQLSHIAVGPTGKVYVTWNKHSGTTFANEVSNIRLRVITPVAAPASVGGVGPLRTVHTETSPIPFGLFPYPAFYRLATYPHVAVKGGRAIIVWDKRTRPEIVFNTFFFDSGIVGKFTDNDGASFSPLQTVSAAFGPQYQPSVCVDNTTGRVVVAYFSHQNDPIFSHKQDVYVATSPTGAAPYTPLRITSVSNDTEADPLLSDTFIGDYIEVACRGGVGYVHYTANYRALPFPLVGGSPTLIIRQQDNFVGRFTLP